MTAFSPLEQFLIVQYIPLWLGPVSFSFTNSAFITMVVVGSYLALYVNYARPQGESLQLGKIQYGLIAKYEFILALFEQLIGSTSKSNTGPGKQFFPLIFSIFTFILLENLIGMLPFSFTPTSHFIVTLGLAVALFIGVTILGFLVHGLHYFSLLLPAGAPLALSPFLVLLELISYVFKAVSLGVRLGANMLAGHCLLKIIAGFSFSMGCSLTGLAWFASFGPLAVIVLLTGLELGIAVIQAYVFTMLLCIYLNEALHLH